MALLDFLVKIRALYDLPFEYKVDDLNLCRAKNDFLPRKIDHIPKYWISPGDSCLYINSRNFRSVEVAKRNLEQVGLRKEMTKLRVAAVN